MAGGRAATRAGAVLLAAALLAACTGTAPPELPGDEPSVPASPSVAAPSGDGPGRGAAVAGRQPRLVPVARVPLTGLPVAGGLRLSGQRAVVTGCARCDRDGDVGAVHVVDLGTGRVRRAAVSSFEQGVAVTAGLDGDHLVWLDVEPSPRQLAGRTRWRLQVTDLRTGRSRLLAASPQTRTDPPWALTGGGRAAWQEWSGDGLTGDVRVADLRTGEQRLVRRLPGPLGAVTARALLYVGATDPADPSADVADLEVPADAYAMPLSPGPPAPLSTSHDVGSVTTDGRTALWTTPRGFPTAVWAAPLAGGPARIVYSGPTVERVAGDGFAAVLTVGASVLEVAPLEGGRVLTAPDVPLEDAGLAAEGRRLAWIARPGRDVPVDARHPLELVVAEVR